MKSWAAGEEIAGAKSVEATVGSSVAESAAGEAELGPQLTI